MARTNQPTTATKDIYELFNDFFAKTIIEKKSFFPENSNEEIFSNSNLEVLIKRYVNDIIGDKKEGKGKDLFIKLNKKENESLSFMEKINEQFRQGNVFGSENEVSPDAKKVFGHLMWLQYLPATKPQDDENGYGKNKCAQIKGITGIDVKYECDGRAKYGMAAMRLDNDLTDLVLLFNDLVNNKWKIDELQESTEEEAKLEQIKKYIIKWCLDLKEDGTLPDNNQGIRTYSYKKNASKRKCPTELLPIHNMLLHLCKKEHYDDISVTGHKKKIVETFDGLIPRKKENEKELLDLSKADKILDDNNEYNKKYYIIINELNKFIYENNKSDYTYKKLWGDKKDSINENVKIYKYKDLWNVGQDKDYSDINALKFKKAIILYGPPGTSKTYSAKGLAKNLIYRLDYPKNVADFLTNNNIVKNQIHRLQLHPNYTYEDFVWGYQIENNQTIPKKGYFLKLLDEISKSKENAKKHVLILDEINRVDLSRLFGELFSAIENRNEPVDLPVEVENTKQITIPENLYIIGTMNEIDFSLERVDFALRRRFSWFFYGFNEEALKDIIEYKLEEKSIKKFTDELQTKYIQACNELNKKIDDDPDLGNNYEIGHTFFAELVDIWKDMPQKEIKYIQEILWNISICPMIEAYLGNSEEKDRKKTMDSFKATFLIDKD